MLGPRFYMQWFLSFLVAWTPVVSQGQTSTSAGPSPASPIVAAPITYSFAGEGGALRATQKNITVEMPETPTDKLLEFSPTKMNLLFQEDMKRGRAGEAFSHAMKNFPRESFLFFLAIGGVTAFQLATDYSSDPMRMQHHVEHSMSPLGMFSFFSFMVANGYASSTIAAWTQNPKFHAFIPYLGMTAGFFVQSTISTLFSDPAIAACSRAMLGKRLPTDSPNACESAFSFYVVKKHLLNLAPSLVSMMAATALAGLIQKGITAGLFRLTGVDLALMALPGGVVVQGARILLMSTAQMALFYFIDAGFLNRRITYAWKNAVDGASLAMLQRELVQLITTKKTVGWKDRECFSAVQDQDSPDFGMVGRALPGVLSTKPSDCSRDLARPIQEFQEAAAEWRTMNLMDVIEAHQMWQEKLGTLNGQYIYSFSFYRDLVTEVVNSRQKNGDARMRWLDLPTPLMGTSAQGVDADKTQVLYNRPAFYEGNASKHVVSVAEKLQAQLASKELDWLTPSQKKTLSTYADQLISGVPDTQGRAIFDLNQALGDARTRADATMRQEKFGLSSPDSSTRWMTTLQELRRQLGPDPVPMYEPGRGFIAAYARFDENGKKGSSKKFPTQTGAFQTPEAPEHLLVQSICGPDLDKNRMDSVVQERMGYASSFLAPRLTETGPMAAPLCKDAGLFGAQPTVQMYHKQIVEADGILSNGLVDYLKNRVRPQLLGGGSAFSDWWKQRTEEAMKIAYDDYGAKYNEIVIKMIKALWRAEDSSWNRGPLANGIATSVRQQTRFNLMFLGELLKDTYQIKRGQPLLKSFFNTRPEPSPVVRTELAKADSLPLMAALADGGVLEAGRGAEPVLEWNRLARAYPSSESAKTAGAPIGYPLQLQKEIDYEMEVLFHLLTKIKVQPKQVMTGRSAQKTVETVSSQIENDELETQVQKIEAKLTEFAQLLGVAEKAAEGDPTFANASSGTTSEDALPMPGIDPVKADSPRKRPTIVNLTKEQKRAAISALDGILKAANELSFYGTIANSVSWEKLNRSESQSESQRRVNEEKKALLSQIGAFMNHRPTTIGESVYGTKVDN